MTVLDKTQLSVIAQAILQDKQIAFAITDYNLTITELNDTLDFFHSPLTHTAVGTPLTRLVPELFGSDDTLDDILSGKLPRFELSCINRETRDGKAQYLNLICLPHKDSNGRIRGILFLVQDISEVGDIQQQLTQHRNDLRLLQKQLVEQNINLVSANRELQRLSDMKSTFVSIAAHELKSPLTAIVGYSELLLDGTYGELNAEQVEVLQIMLQSAGRLQDIAETLLLTAKIDTGRIELTLQPMDMAALINDLIKEFAPQVNAQSHNLTFNAEPNLPYALCDKDQAQLIISNLLGNATKYTAPEGQIDINLSSANGSGFLQVSVADTGMGIPRKDQDKLFERFFRAANASMTGASGTGLGLYIVKSLVELHGGQIWFESEENKGTTFYVTFPIADWAG